MSTFKIQDDLYSAANVSFLLVSIVLFNCKRCPYTYQHHQVTTFSTLVCIVCALLCLANVTALINDASSALINFSAGIQGLSWMMIGLMVRSCSTRCVGILLCSWSFLMLVGSSMFLLMGGNTSISIQTGLNIAALPTSFLVIISTIRAIRKLEKLQHQFSSELQEPLLNDDRCRLAEAGFLSRVFFTWMSPLLALGYKSSIERNDVPRLGDEDKAETSYLKFLEFQEVDKHKTISTLQALLRCNWKEMAVTGVFAFLKTLTVSCNPLFLQFFINFASHRRPAYQGFMFVSCLFLAKLVECLSQRHWNFGSRRIGLRVRSCLIAAIYDKELRLSHEARQRHSGGDIVSYISVDTYRLGEFPWWMHQIWTVPLQILVALCILVSIVKWAALAGVVIIVLTAAVQTPLAKSQQKFQYNFMVAQDKRLRITSAILSSMKIIKLQAWEGKFKQLVERCRDTEFGWLSRIKQIWAYGSIMFWMSPIVTASVVFAACIPLGITLDASVIFTVLATFRVIQEPVRYAPDVLTAIIQARVSMGRLAKFFDDEELQQEAVDREVCEDGDGFAILIENEASFGWETSGSRAALININLKVAKREIVAVCGSVGSGKSTLLHSVLGETVRLSGTANVRGSIAYVAQTAWIQSGTVMDNILFGNAMNESRYKRTLEACALEEDLASFSHGDLTEIGERGLNLSGGQKQRIQLARALYADADVYLLDDPFSALDAQTSATLFKAFILDALSAKTVFLVTHQVEFLSAVDTILVMDAGQIAQAGHYHELLKPGNLFEQLVNAHEDAMVNVQTSSTDDRHVNVNFNVSGISSSAQVYPQLTREEEKETGDLGLKPYKDYIKTADAGVLFISALVAQTLFISATISSNYWLATQVENPSTSVYALIGVFSSISFVSTGIVYGRARLLVAVGLRASQAFFNELMESLFHAPMAVFDSTPLGRMMSRVSSDMSLLDVDVPTCLSFVVSASFDLAGMLVVMAMVTWQILFISVPMLFVLKWIQGYYLATARELMRLNGTTKAPILNKTAESVYGAVTIRAFRKQEQFKNINRSLIDSDAAVSLHTFASYEWLAVRVEILGTVLLSSAALFMVLLKDKIPPGFAGLSLSYALALNQCQVFLIQWASNMAGYIVSVERISQYMHLPKEAPSVIQSNRPPSAWPTQGKVELQNLQIRYRNNSPLVLKGISCTFPGGKRIGLVGRTGSGKTTLISALFRLVEPSAGTVLIDGIDISNIGLFDLRSKLGIIPQEAFLFQGTVRSNLDPLQQFSDQQIWETLQKCQLSKVIKETSNQLDTLVTDEGENWSAGQRQLFCLARVLLKRSRVLVLDEATASIDSTTDSILQRVIREEFAGSTVITVAHRIPTVIDSDMILGLQNGNMIEYDTPTRLLETKGSLFAKLVTEYWFSCNKK